MIDDPLKKKLNWTFKGKFLNSFSYFLTPPPYLKKSIAYWGKNSPQKGGGEVILLSKKNAEGESSKPDT